MDACRRAAKRAGGPESGGSGVPTHAQAHSGSSVGCSGAAASSTVSWNDKFPSATSSPSAASPCVGWNVGTWSGGNGGGGGGMLEHVGRDRTVATLSRAKCILMLASSNQRARLRRLGQAEVAIVVKRRLLRLVEV